jgi:hypothetical protein
MSLEKTQTNAHMATFHMQNVLKLTFDPYIIITKLGMPP